MMAEKDVKDRLSGEGADPIASTPADFAAFVRRGGPQMGRGRQGRQHPADGITRQNSPPLSSEQQCKTKRGAVNAAKHAIAAAVNGRDNLLRNASHTALSFSRTVE